MGKAQHNLKQGFKPNENGYSTKTVYWLADPEDVDTRIEVTDEEAKSLIELDKYYEDDEDESDK